MGLEQSCLERDSPIRLCNPLSSHRKHFRFIRSTWSDGWHTFFFCIFQYFERKFIHSATLWPLQLADSVSLSNQSTKRGLWNDDRGRIIELGGRGTDLFWRLLWTFRFCPCPILLHIFINLYRQFGITLTTTESYYCSTFGKFISGGKQFSISTFPSPGILNSLTVKLVQSLTCSALQNPKVGWNEIVDDL